MNKIINVLEHIFLYCKDIEDTMERFGKDKEVFAKDRDYRNSVCMSLLQIGELTTHLPEDFRENTKKMIYWPAIKGTRNLFAHNYGAVDIDMVWGTLMSDIPQLRDFCQKWIQGLRNKEGV
ncbi:MAG: DUF86 domain-containing protein [Eubacterium sp.]|jgi:uncharacterized protein with HEPN domain|nr:DUF86 domain-containing protein [Eubacterium sp.]